MDRALPMPETSLTARERFFIASLVGDAGTILKKPDCIAFSAWTGHVPFAFWVTRACRPGTIVELGSHYGVSFGAFCQQTLLNDSDCLRGGYMERR